jgi:hypothetical protein
MYTEKLMTYLQTANPSFDGNNPMTKLRRNLLPINNLTPCLEHEFLEKRICIVYVQLSFFFISFLPFLHTLDSAVSQPSPERAL